MISFLRGIITNRSRKHMKGDSLLIQVRSLVKLLIKASTYPEFISMMLIATLSSPFTFLYKKEMKSLAESILTKMKSETNEFRLSLKNSVENGKPE